MILYPNILKLYDYAPENDMITSESEINRISSELQFDKATIDDLQNYRTMIVLLWNQKIEKAQTTEEMRKQMSAMQSLTSVIDHEIFIRGGEV